MCRALMNVHKNLCGHSSPVFVTSLLVVVLPLVVIVFFSSGKKRGFMLGDAMSC